MYVAASFRGLLFRNGALPFLKWQRCRWWSLNGHGCSPGAREPWWPRPTRFKVGRKAGDVRQLQALTEQANKLDQRNGLAKAAEQILALVGSLRAHDRHTRGHSERVRVYTDLIAAELRLPPCSSRPTAVGGTAA
jgi:hypothetical protein